ncbi:hypothetical protein TNCV_1888951 [Trichonephila clavipes]|nr:hypothetical protein TNCV_1888951 [Trichonephila clavipes]
MILLRLSRKRDEAPIAVEAMGLAPVGPCLKMSLGGGCGSPVVNVSDHGRHVMRSSLVPLKTPRVGQRCPLNLSRAEMSSRWCGVVVKRGGTSSGVVHIT